MVVLVVQRGGNQLCICASRGLPEEGVVLNADLPQSLRGPVVGQLKANGALELFVLIGSVTRWGRKEGRKKRKDREGSAGKGGGTGGWGVIQHNQYCV